MPDIAVLGGFALALLGGFIGRGRPAARAVALAIGLGFLFWYWLPAANLFWLGYRGPGSLAVPQEALVRAAWLALAYHAAATAAVGLAARLAYAEPQARSGPAPRWLGPLALASALAFAFVRFDDPRLTLAVLSTAESARDHLHFFNRSASVHESLEKLWEILTLWCALFALAWAADRRALAEIGGLAAAAAVVVLLLVSGARLTVLMALFAAVAALVLRPRGERGRAALPALLAAGGLAALIVAAVAARFREEGLARALAGSLLVNNDMLSETAFVLARFPGQVWGGARDFLVTPVSFMMPGFLGFDKAIPAHLIAFNKVRAGIDLLTGQGNVFPGIVGDFAMVFGPWRGVPLFAGLVLVFALLADALARGLPDPAVRRAWAAATAAFLFVSLRNTQGSLVLVALAGFCAAWAAMLVRVAK